MTLHKEKILTLWYVTDGYLAPCKNLENNVQNNKICVQSTPDRIYEQAVDQIFSGIFFFFLQMDISYKILSARVH